MTRRPILLPCGGRSGARRRPASPPALTPSRAAAASQPIGIARAPEGPGPAAGGGSGRPRWLMQGPSARDTRPAPRTGWPIALAVAAAALVLGAAAPAAAAGGLACPAREVCRAGRCAPVRDDAGARLVPLGASGVGLASDGPPLPVEAISRGSGADLIVTYFTPDGAELISVRAADLAFTYRRNLPKGALIMRGRCTPD